MSYVAYVLYPNLYQCGPLVTYATFSRGAAMSSLGTSPTHKKIVTEWWKLAYALAQVLAWCVVGWCNVQVDPGCNLPPGLKALGVSARGPGRKPGASSYTLTRLSLSLSLGVSALN